MLLAGAGAPADKESGRSDGTADCTRAAMRRQYLGTPDGGTVERLATEPGRQTWLVTATVLLPACARSYNAVLYSNR